MKFETLKKDYRKPILIIAGVVVAIVATVFFVGTRAKYRYTATYQAVKGTINYDEPDLWVTALYIEQEDGSYKSAENVPTSGYTLNETETYCGYSSVNGLVKDETIKVTYENGNIKVSDITKVGTKCHIYFDEEKIPAKDVILAQNTIDTTRKSGSFTGVYTTSTAGKIFEGPADDYGDTTYFFAGANPNNWVKFGEFYWRIIRINGDNSIRMIYNGTSMTTTGLETQIQTTYPDKTGQLFNSYRNDNAYVGYMYGSTGQTYENTHKNTNSSTIKTEVDNWYNKNLNKIGIKEYIDTTIGFCGDRQPSTSESSINNTGGTGTVVTYYGSYIRANTTHQFTYKCNQSNDLYTTSNSRVGNKALTYPIGLITTDEMAFAGGFVGKENTSYWLYTNQYYWTMSPSYIYYYNHAYNATVFKMFSNGSVGQGFVDGSTGVRPVINLRAYTALKGKGITSDPYVVK